MSERKDIVPEGFEWQYEKFQFAPVVRVGDTIHVSGVIGTREDGSVDDDPTRQFAQAFSNLATMLKATSCTMTDVVEMTTFHVGLQQNMRAFMAAKRSAMPGPPHPAWTAIEIVELAIPGGLVEIRATVQDRWRAVKGPHLVALVRAGAVFHNGVLVERDTNKAAA